MAEQTQRNSHTSPPVSDDTTREMSSEESKQELKDAIRGSNQVLVRATTVLTLFPDTLTMDRTKLTVAHRMFFRTAEVMSIRMEDILNVTCTVGPIFGTIKVTSRVMSPDKPAHIGLFWRSEAEKIKRITQGYVIALQRNIDCSSLGTEELASMLDKLGMDDHPTDS